MDYLWEILVPTVMNGKPIRTRYHRVWDEKVRKFSGGLTILTPAKGHWVAPDGELFVERMIPVRLKCDAATIEKVADMTAKYYNQLAVMYYAISNNVHIKHYDKVTHGKGSKTDSRSVGGSAEVLGTKS